VSRRGWRRRILLAALVAGLGSGAGVSLGGSPAAAETTPAGGTTPACPSYNPPNTMTLVAGTPQSAKLGAQYATDLQVSISNSNGCPVTTGLAGIPVTFAAPSSGPSGRFASSGSNAVLVGTNAAGVAAAPQFAANRLPGGFAVVASSDYGTVGFSLVNTASGVPATISTVPASESATVGSRYAQSLEATVLDADGNPVEGVAVVFTLGASGGVGGGAGGSTAAAGASFSGGGTQVTETTDSSGVAASPSFTANGTAGSFTASAAAAGIVEPASFRLANLAGKPPKIGALAPAKQWATVSARYAKPLRVRVLGGNGKPLAGASITFTLGSGSAGGGGDGAGGSGGASSGASFVGGSSQVTEVADASGIATSPRFTANTTPGRFTATATMSGTAAAAAFSLDNRAGKPPALTVVGGAKRSATIGSRYAGSLVVKVRDGHGRPLQGAIVTFTLGSSGGADGGSGAASAAGASFVGGSAQATETTNAAGIASSPRLTANTTAGTFTATAFTTGATAAASFELHNVAGTPTALTTGVAANESTTVATRFPIRLAVTVTDAHQNPVAGVAVTFAAPARGPSGRFGKRRIVRAKTDANGVAIARPLVANGLTGGYVVLATAAGHSAAFALVNRPGG
jgi:protocatechuate 3,4-dioxygenase beta subunit